MKSASLPRLGALAAALLLSVRVVAAESPKPTDPLPRATPESQGVSSAALQAILDEQDARKYGMHGLMIVRHGKVIAEGWWAPYAASEPHMLFSLSKSFTSTAIGLLQSEGRLNIHDKLVSFFPDDVPADASDNLKAMRLRDLLMMSTGQEKPDVDKINVNNPDKTGTKSFFAAPVKQKPGTLFYYNSPATFMLSATVTKVTGQTLRDYLVPRIFEPLGIPLPDWDETPQGYNVGASGLHIRTEDIAKFGQLLLQRGEWQGRRLVPAEWVDLATSRQASNGSDPEGDWDQGYGFQFWRCVPGFYRADGAFGQFCIVMPQYDTVVAITGGTKDTKGVMKLLWAKLLPELRPAAIPENPDAQAALRNRLANLTLPLPAGAATSTLAAKVSGKEFVFEKNDLNLDSVSLTIAPDGAVTFKARRYEQDQTIVAGRNEWKKGAFLISRNGTPPVAAAGAWTADDTYTVAFAQLGQPFLETFHLKFTGDTVTLEREFNVGPASNKPVTLTGKVRP
jgi:CubicO group peptidase (beta-lactamase class C family)